MHILIVPLILALFCAVVYWGLTREKKILLTFKKFDAILTTVLSKKQDTAALLIAEEEMVAIFKTGTFDKKSREIAVDFLANVRSLIDSRKKINLLEQQLAAITHEIECLERVDAKQAEQTEQTAGEVKP